MTIKFNNLTVIFPVCFYLSTLQFFEVGVAVNRLGSNTFHRPRVPVTFPSTLSTSGLNWQNIEKSLNSYQKIQKYFRLLRCEKFGETRYRSRSFPVNGKPGYLRRRHFMIYQPTQLISFLRNGSKMLKFRHSEYVSDEY